MTLKDWLASNKHASECGITEELIDRLKVYKVIRFDRGQKVYSFTYEEILRRYTHETSCPSCRELQMRIHALEVQLGQQTKQVPPLQLIIEDFIDKNYTATCARLYKRTLLFKEVNEYLREKYNTRLERDDSIWTWLIEDKLNSKSKQYRKLKVMKRS
jgi:hypothetical protein